MELVHTGHRHTLIIASPDGELSIKVRMSVDTEWFYPANHRCFLMIGKDGDRYVIAIHNSIQTDDFCGKLLRFFKHNCKFTNKSQLRYIEELKNE